jgi:folate-binding protein YgfZ
MIDPPSNCFYAPLTDRGLVCVAGSDAVAFLHTIVTCDIEKLQVGTANYGALLTPQGKINCDFLIVALEQGFLLDLPARIVAELIKRLTLYKLRAKVDLSDASGTYQFTALWPVPIGDRPTGIVVADPRHGELGLRCYRAAGEEGWGALQRASAQDWHAHRIRLGVPEAEHDFTYGEVFPHDVDMDQLSGVDFNKGCYIGQEVVSRMEHRGTARRRIVQVSGAAALPPRGTPLMAQDRGVGHLKSVDGAVGLASIRIDRVAAAMAKGVKLTAEGAPVEFTIPTWARFNWPQP